MKIISFEGYEYSGKSTQINLLQKYFKSKKIKSTFTREPGGNKELEKIRNIILQSDFDNLSLILFFFASRFSLLSTMKKDNLVVFDRFFDSTYAYQKITAKDKALIINLINHIDKKFIPTITFYFKINKKTLLQRKMMRGQKNYFDKKYASHFTRIQSNYEEIAKMKIGKRKFITIDASKTTEIIHNEIVGHLKKCKLIK
ncbi:dTMP kinase [Alphaproteobacteria bacterium]|nr:dTMP kinase [Alphaproteobacteria bacterium]